MQVALLREWQAGERRVALVPEAVAKLVQLGHRVEVESGAGLEAHYPDDAYRQAGATIAPSRAALLAAADMVLGLRPPLADPEFLQQLRPGCALIGLLQPLTEAVEHFQALAERGVLSFSLDAMPRISRAQSMDVLSSMSTIAGYRAVIMAAERLGKFFPMLITAAGTIAPAQVLVLGAGVAGLQAIATAHRLGAVVRAFDTRPVVREQVESLGATFLTLEVQGEQTGEGYAQALSQTSHEEELRQLSAPVAAADVVITTALVPGQRAPILVTRQMVEAMRPGSVIVDLAAEAGGNVELSRPGEVVDHGGVLILAPLNVPSQVPLPASQLFSRNLVTFIQHLLASGLTWAGDPPAAEIALEDEIVRRTAITYRGQVVSELVRPRLAGNP